MLLAGLLLGGFATVPPESRRACARDRPWCQGGPRPSASPPCRWNCNPVILSWVERWRMRGLSDALGVASARSGIHCRFCGPGRDAPALHGGDAHRRPTPC
jgi:hypothetical protein